MRHADFLRDVAGVEPPARLQPLLTLLVGAGGEVVDPADRVDLHPLVVPLVREPSGATLGFLRWPTPPARLPLPIVRQHAEDPERAWTLELVSRSTDAHVHRELALRDLAGDPIPDELIAAIDRDGPLYAPGELAASGLPLQAYLLLRIGETHAFFEQLAEKHVERGDTTAALVTAERACREDDGWARPWAYHALLMARLDRPAEARDLAAAALTDPVWTLGHPFEAVARLAGWTTFGSAAYRELAANAKKPAADRAAHLLDAAAVDRAPWASVRESVADLYAEAELDAVARLVRA